MRIILLMGKSNKRSHFYVFDILTVLGDLLLTHQMRNALKDVYARARAVTYNFAIERYAFKGDMLY